MILHRSASLPLTAAVVLYHSSTSASASSSSSLTPIASTTNALASPPSSPMSATIASVGSTASAPRGNPTSALTDLDRETLRLFGVSVDDENEEGNLFDEEERIAGINEREIQEDEILSALEETKQRIEGPSGQLGDDSNGDIMAAEKKASPATSAAKSYMQENEAESAKESDDEWWRDPFRLFELESTVIQQSSPEVELSDAPESLAHPAEGEIQTGRTTQVPAAVSDELDLLKKGEPKTEQTDQVVSTDDINAVDSDTRSKKDVNDETLQTQQPSAPSSQQLLQPLTEQKPSLPADRPTASDNAGSTVVQRASTRTFTLPVFFPFALSKFQSITNIPVSKYVFYVAAAQVVWSWIQNVPAIRRVAPEIASPKSRVPPKTAKADREGRSTNEVAGPQAERESLPDDDVDKEEIQALERLGFRQSAFRVADADKMEEECEEEEDAMDTEVKFASSGAKRRRPGAGMRQGGIFRWLLNGDARKSSTSSSLKEVGEERDIWKDRAQIAESEVESVQRDWSECVQQLEEAKAQCVRLQSTNRYLKEQLRDSQRETEETLKRERQRATDELARIREAMVEVLDRERKLMRDHMMSASKEVRAAILMAEDENYIRHSTEDEE